MSTSVVERWDRFWFEPAPATSLAVCRVLICVAIAHRLLSQPVWDPTSIYGVIPRLPAGLWRPTSFIWALGLGPPTEAQLTTIYAVALVALLFTAAGLLTRPASLVLAITGLYLILLPSCWGRLTHGGHVPAMMMMLLPFTRAGDALSIDSLLWRRGSGPAEPSGHYRWPVLLFQLSFALMLFFASWSKLTTSGLVWIDSPNLRNQILSQQFTLGRGEPYRFALWVAAEPWRWKLAALGAVSTQASFILIVFVRNLWLRLGLFTFGVGFLAGLIVLMRLPNPELMLLLLVFVDWNAVESWFRGGGPSRVHAHLTNRARLSSLGEQRT